MSREKGFTMLVDWFQPPYIKKAKDFMLKIHLLKHYQAVKMGVKEEMRCSGGLYIVFNFKFEDDEGKSGVYPLNSHYGAGPPCKN